LGSSAVSFRFVVVAEDELGYRLVRDLGDRVIAERGAPWLQSLWQEEAIRVQQRRWTGFHTEQPWFTRADVKRLAAEHSIRAHGLGMKAERAIAHKAAEIAVKLVRQGTIEKIDVLFLVHDTDGDKDVANLMHDGASGKGGRRDFQVTIAAPHPESEAWVIAGAARGPSEPHAERAEEQRRLGFDPVRSPERLSANRATDKRDAKRVCEALLGARGEGYAGWEPCWMKTSLEDLEQNAARAGLRDYTRQVEQIILPLLGDKTPR